MRAPLSWIRDFTPAEASVDQLVAALNQLGLEVEAVEEPGLDVRGVIAAKVLGVVDHPNADKLTLVDVDFGSGQTRVVCGARNLAPGDVVPFAPAGAQLPGPDGGFTLERRKFRGEVSDGMLCSSRELGVGDDHAGILQLDGSTPLGADVREVLGLDDVIFDLSITPNRPDAMCVVGVARELAAHFGWPLTVDDPSPPTDPDAARPVTVEIEAPDRCPRYLGRVATVRLGPSPIWMAQRLVKAGMRPISNVVDVTNYVLLERNQPLHAFDVDRLAGPGIVVRTATDGERITTLDGVERTLTSDELLICDAERAPQAIAGIMGGGDSEVSDATTAILLESAYFSPMGIARSSKRLKLRSESSARFERGIDPDGIARHADRAMDLLVTVAGAAVAPDAVDAYPRPVERPRIRVRTTKVNGVLGTTLTDTEILDALRPLGIDVEGAGDDITAVPPTFRPDLEREIDLVEEVARRVGFDAIGRTVPKPAEQVGALSHAQRDRRAVVDALVGVGLAEAVSVPLVSPEELSRAGAPVDRVVEAANPLRAEDSVLRTQVLPGLLRAAERNQAHGLPDVGLFEIGRVFLAPRDGAPTGGAGPHPEEAHHVAAVLAGSVRRRPVEDDRPVDGHDAVDLVRAVADALEIAELRLESDTVPGFHPARAARIVVEGETIGRAGEVAPAVVEGFGLEAPVAAFELDVDRLLAAPRRDRTYVAPSPYPPSNIDLAFVVPETADAGAVERTLRVAGADLLEDVRLFDVFRSDSFGAGRTSLAFALRFRAPDRTLTDADVGELRERAIAAVEQAHGATLRG